MNDQTLIYGGFDQETLDRQYSPSSCIDDINVFLEKYAQFSQNARDRALADGTGHFDLRYGAGAEERLDLFRARSDARAPLQIFIHGGYWQLLSKDESGFAASMFQDNGCAFAAVNYTLCPHQSLSGIVAENRRAIKWLYDNAEQFNVDRNRLYISGSSAGAHLCAMMLLTAWKEYDIPGDVIKGVCAMSGIYDLEPVRLTYVNDKVGMDESEARRNSPAARAPRHPCPTIVSYGDNETEEFKRQSVEYAALLRKHGCDVAEREIPARNHFDIVFDLMERESWLAQAVLSQMRV